MINSEKSLCRQCQKKLYFKSFPQQLESPKNPEKPPTSKIAKPLYIMANNSNSGDIRAQCEKLIGFLNWPVCLGIIKSMTIKKDV